MSQGLRPLSPAPTLGKRAVSFWIRCAGSSALLGSLVVGCFACFSFPMKCAEASRLLETVFYGNFIFFKDMVRQVPGVFFCVVLFLEIL